MGPPRERRKVGRPTKGRSAHSSLAETSNQLDELWDEIQKVPFWQFSKKAKLKQRFEYLEKEEKFWKAAETKKAPSEGNHVLTNIFGAARVGPVAAPETGAAVSMGTGPTGVTGVAVPPLTWMTISHMSPTPSVSSGRSYPSASK